MSSTQISLVIKVVQYTKLSTKIQKKYHTLYNVYHTEIALGPLVGTPREITVGTPCNHLHCSNCVAVGRAAAWNCINAVRIEVQCGETCAGGL